jgi:NarL family two-component system response regulator LiaR
MTDSLESPTVSSPDTMLMIKPNTNLAPREHQVLKALSCGHPYKRIASDLGVSISTIQTLVERSYRKLQVNNKIEAVLKYARES